MNVIMYTADKYIEQLSEPRTAVTVIKNRTPHNFMEERTLADRGHDPQLTI